GGDGVEGLGDGVEGDDVFDRLKAAMASKDTFKVGGFNNENLRVVNWIKEGSHDWDLDNIALHCSSTELDATKKIPIGAPNMPDEWKWKYNLNGLFRVKSAYYLMRNNVMEAFMDQRSLSNEPLPPTKNYLLLVEMHK
ncbi:hypothetical protein LINPERHAP1_LOCUS3765, partial [Linum perenne]